jgi:hypothetical protein
MEWVFLLSISLMQECVYLFHASTSRRYHDDMGTPEQSFPLAKASSIQFAIKQNAPHVRRAFLSGCLDSPTGERVSLREIKRFRPYNDPAREIGLRTS